MLSVVVWQHADLITCTVQIQQFPNMFQITFKYFIILILSTQYILCVSWIIKCLIIIDARCKHEEC